MEQEVHGRIGSAEECVQAHAMSADGAVLIRRKLRRSEVIRFFAELPPYLVGMEACASTRCDSPDG